MPRGALTRTTKERADTASTGAAGFSLTSLRFEKADAQLLHPTAHEEVEINGVLELRNEKKQAYGVLLLVQIKAFDDIDSTGDALRYVVKPVDAACAELPGARTVRYFERLFEVLPRPPGRAGELRAIGRARLRDG